MTTLEQLKLDQCVITSVLASNKLHPCSEEINCCTAEEVRPLTLSEHKKGWHCRPFNAYNPDKMCCSCRAFWFASMTANAIDDMRCQEILRQREPK